MERKGTNLQFSKQDETFKVACELAKCEPTRRQASKWRRGLGRALMMKRKAAEVLRQKEINRIWKESADETSES